MEKPPCEVTDSRIKYVTRGGVVAKLILLLDELRNQRTDGLVSAACHHGDKPHHSGVQIAGAEVFVQKRLRSVVRQGS